ncbi:MAG: cyanophycin synthetase [Planctomycetota bacterium]
MEVMKITTLSGANRWAAHSVLEAHLDWSAAGRFAADSSAWIPTLRERLAELTAMIEQAPPLVRQQDVDVAQLTQPLYQELAADARLPQVLAQLTQLFHVAAGVCLPPPTSTETDEPSVAVLAIGYEEPALAQACLESARRCLLAALTQANFDLPAEGRQLIDLADDLRLGPSSRGILRAAEARSIPFRRLTSGSLVQLGEGRWQRRIWTAETDRTSAIADNIASDKELTKRLLRAAGVPVPLGRVVTSGEDAWNAALEIGLPVVVKPRKANHSRGISLDLTNREQVLTAYDWAVLDGNDTGVIVEQYARGTAHRLLVVGSRLVAAARGQSEYVYGDGESTIQQLVTALNLDPRRGRNYTDPLCRVMLDDSALIELRKQNYTADSVPPLGQRVLVQPVGDLTTDCTADVHPENAAQAVLAARIVGLDVAGLDVIAEDISQPFKSQRGAVLEVNAGPSLGVHIAPLHGDPQPVGRAIIDLLFPNPGSAKITIVGITGSGPGCETAAVLDQLLAATEHVTGRATTAGTYFNRVLIDTALADEAARFDTLLLHPDIDIALVASSPEHIWHNGLGYDRLDRVVITDCPANDLVESPAGGGGDYRVRQAVIAALRAVPAHCCAVLPAKLAHDSDLLTLLQGRPIFYAPLWAASDYEPLLKCNAQVVTTTAKELLLVSSAGQQKWPLPKSWPTDAARVALELAALAAAWSCGLTREQFAKSI